LHQKITIYHSSVPVTYLFFNILDIIEALFISLLAARLVF